MPQAEWEEKLHARSCNTCSSQGQFPKKIGSRCLILFGGRWRDPAVESKYISPALSYGDRNEEKPIAEKRG